MKMYQCQGCVGDDSTRQVFVFNGPTREESEWVAVWYCEKCIELARCNASGSMWGLFEPEEHEDAEAPENPEPVARVFRSFTLRCDGLADINIRPSMDDDTVALEQGGDRIWIPMYALAQFLEALDDMRFDLDVVQLGDEVDERLASLTSAAKLFS